MNENVGSISDNGEETDLSDEYFSKVGLNMKKEDDECELE